MFDQTLCKIDYWAFFLLQTTRKIINPFSTRSPIKGGGVISGLENVFMRNRDAGSEGDFMILL